MSIAAGILHRRRFVLGRRDHDALGLTALYNFGLSSERPSFSRLFDSAFGTPGRYVVEIFRRLLDTEARASLRCIVFNPLARTPAGAVSAVLSLLATRAEHRPESAATVVADRHGVPVAFCLPARLAKDAAALALLSCVDAELDARLVARLLDAEATTVPTRLRVGLGNGFASGPGYLRIYRWTAAHALAVLEHHPGPDRPPLCAIMPYHAGDLLFFSRAAQVTVTGFSGVVVNADYADIVRGHAPRLQPLVAGCPPPNRNGRKVSEDVYFEELMASVPGEACDRALLYYCRPTRPYDAGRAHLIDQFAFALGASVTCERELATRRLTLPVCTTLAPAPIRRVLLHFDGGWPLKIYPVALQRRLIQALAARGCAVTVLGAQPSGCEGMARIRQARFTDLAALRALILDHHVIAGMDSFPVHLAVHALGVPAVCLFGNTRPDNSNAPTGDTYIQLERGLDCRPCGAGRERCKLTGRSECGNFTDVHVVLDAIERLLARASTD